MPTVIWARPEVACALRFSSASSFTRFKSSSDLTAGILIPPAMSDRSIGDLFSLQPVIRPS